jgi:hypothetical protein
MNQNAPRKRGVGLRVVLIGVALIVIFFALAPDAFESLVSTLKAFPRWLERIARDLMPS